jgi:Zn-dependent M32 family carboxypeptidase
MEWLRDEVHSQASRWTVDELLSQATGQPLDPKVFEAHLKARYLP